MTGDLTDYWSYLDNQTPYDQADTGTVDENGSISNPNWLTTITGLATTGARVAGSLKGNGGGTAGGSPAATGAVALAPQQSSGMMTKIILVIVGLVAVVGGFLLLRRRKG